jgi:hypothetical protein
MFECFEAFEIGIRLGLGGKYDEDQLIEWISFIEVSAVAVCTEAIVYFLNESGFLRSQRHLAPPGPLLGVLSLAQRNSSPPL